MAEVTVSPNPVGPDEDYSLSGCGFAMKPAYVYTNGTFTYAVGVVSAGGNCLDNNYFPAPDEPGTYTLEIKQEGDGKGKKGREQQTVATVLLEVVVE